MQRRPLGTTGHESSVLTFGAIALDPLEQSAADELVDEVLDRGVNHVDVAPQYGTAEVKLGPRLQARRDEVFLGCKTLERSKEGAAAKLDASLDRMGVDHIDLYQFHAVTEMDELDEITGPGGALEAVEEAREEGVVDHVGLTSHGNPEVIRAAMDRIDLDTVMFPMNFVVSAKDDADHDYESVLAKADEEDVGAIGIKAFAKQPWPPEEELPREERPYHTWYEPWDEPDVIQDCLNFALSKGMTTITNAGDPDLVPMILDAAENFEELDDEAMAELEAFGLSQESPVPADLG
jgi:aryl-alcohol dehydrogenase-like predicted oxidoreductase